MKLHIGEEVKDPITGLKGVVMARTIFLHGCVRVGVAYKEAKDGKTNDDWHDEARFIAPADREREVVPKELGQKVKDSLSGFAGVTSAQMETQNGCIRYLVTAPKLEKGEPIEHWFDEGRLKGLKKSKADKPPGGPSMAGSSVPRTTCPRS